MNRREKIQLSPSMLAADFFRVGEQLKELEENKVEWLHVDVMDGAFVPSISFGMPVIQSIRKSTRLFFDVHLMIQEPIRYIKEFKDAGADLINIHVEACSDVRKTIQAIKEEGLKVGITLNPETAVEAIVPYLKEIDLVLVMSVHPGFGGQKFIPDTLSKMSEIKKLLNEVNPSCYLEADGGINKDNVAEVIKTGVDVIVAGTAIFKGNIKENIADFIEQIEKGEQE